MADILACPESDQLMKFELGELSEEKSTALINHITNCSNCATRFNSIVAEDSLVDAVRSGVKAPERTEQDTVRRLLEKVRGLVAETKGERADQTQDLPTPAPASNSDTPNFSWVESPDQPAKEDDGLSPAKGPGEIGWLGPYRVLKVLGEGGMGKVFLAEDPALQRSVALKVMKPSLARNKTSVLRFQQEARAAAAIEHDNIIPIYQVGEDRGVPFVAMPLLKGASLDDLLRKAGALQLKQTLRIGIQIAEGLAAAHERKLIHRDIKPGNIWIEPTGGGRVKILDFGLARTTEGETGLTQSGAILGTPSYMPPEQARGEKVDHRADLYSLGCVLYRIATGELPLKGNDTMGMLMALAMQEPTAAKLVKPEMPQALSDLIMKLLAKDPAQRFGSAREVVVALKAVESGGASPTKSETAIMSHSMLQPAADLPMAIPMEPSKTESPFTNLKTNPEMHPAEKAKSAALANDRANPAPAKKKPFLRLVACGLAAVFCFVVLGGGLAYQFLFRTSDGTLLVDIADDLEAKFKNGELVISDAKGNKLYSLKLSDKNKKLPPGEYLIEVTGADGLKLDTKKFEIVKNGERKVMVTLVPPTAIAQKADLLPGKGSTVVRTGFATLDHLDPAKIPPAERFTWQPKELVAVIGESRARHWGGHVAQLEYSPDGKTITCLGGGPVSLFDADTLRLKALLPPMSNVAFSADHKIMVTSNYGDGLWLWDANGPEFKKRARLGDWNSNLALSSDGKTLVEGHTREFRLWDLSGERAMQRAEIKDLKHHITSMAIAPNGKTLAIAYHDDHKVQLWDLTGAQPQERNALASRNNSRPEFSPDSKILAIPGANNDTELWNLSGAKPQKQASVPGGGIAVFSQDGKKLAVSGGNDHVFLYEMNRPEPVPAGELRCFAHCMAFSPDGKTLATGREFGILQLWDLTELKERIRPEGHTRPLEGALASPDGKWMATYASDCLCIWDMSGPTPRLRTEHKKGAASASFSPDSKTLATSDNNGTALLWDLTTAEPEIRTKIQPEKALQLRQIAFAPDGKTLALNDFTESEIRIRIWDVSGDEPKEKFVLSECQGPFAFLPNGKRLVSGTYTKNWFPGSMQLWDLTGESPTKISTPFGGPYTGLAMAPDGKTLISYDSAKGMTSWDVSGAKPKERAVFEDPDFNAHNFIVTPTYSSDGKTVVFASGKIVSLWDVTGFTAKQLRKWQFPGGVAKASFAPDGRHLITANANGTAYVLRLTPVNTPALDPDRQVAEWALSHGGMVAVVSADKYLGGIAKVKDLPTGPFKLSGVVAQNSRLTVAGLEHFKPASNLQTLILSFGNLGNDDLAKIKTLNNLDHLVLSNNNLTDAGLEHLNTLTNLRALDLSNNPGIGSAGLAHLKDLHKLQELFLFGSGVSDVGLDHLKALKQLKSLNIHKTKVTADGVKKLSAALPGCKIESDHGTILGAKWVNADGSPLGAFPPLDPAWLKQVAAMPAKEQVKAVADKLKERNPGFDPKEVTHQLDKAGIVRELYFLTDNVIDISPVRALTGLRKLYVNGSNPGKGRLADLSPLKEMKLTFLLCARNNVSDLSPLKGMPLTDLDCSSAKVATLSPLTGMRLEHLHCDFNAERDGPILRSITTLKTINGKDAKEFLK